MIVTVTKQSLTQCLQEIQTRRRLVVQAIRNRMSADGTVASDDLHNKLVIGGMLLKGLSGFEDDVRDALTHADDPVWINQWTLDNIAGIAQYLMLFSPEFVQVLQEDAGVTTGTAAATVQSAYRQ